MNYWKHSSSKEMTIVSHWNTLGVRAKINNVLRQIQGFFSDIMNYPISIVWENTAKNSFNVKDREFSKLALSMLNRVDQLDDSESILRRISIVVIVLWKSMKWSDQEKLEYINVILLPFLENSWPLPEILEWDTHVILRMFRNILKNKCMTIIKGNPK